MFKSITSLFATTTEGSSKKINESIISLPTNTFISNTHNNTCPCELEEIAKYADQGSVTFGDFQSSSGCDRCRAEAQARDEGRRAEEERRAAKEQRREQEGGADLLVFDFDFNMADVSTEVARTFVPQGSMIGGVGLNSITLLRASPAKQHRASSVFYASSSKSSLDAPTSHRKTKIYGRAPVSVTSLIDSGSGSPSISPTRPSLDSSNGSFSSFSSFASTNSSFSSGPAVPVPRWQSQGLGLKDDGYWTAQGHRSLAGWF